MLSAIPEEDEDNMASQVPSASS